MTSAVLYRDTKTHKLYEKVSTKTGRPTDLNHVQKIFIFPKPDGKTRNAGRGMGHGGGGRGMGHGGMHGGHGSFGRGSGSTGMALAATSPNRSFAYGYGGGWGRGRWGRGGWGFYRGWYWNAAFLASLIVLSSGGYIVPWNVLLTWPLFMPYYSYYYARYRNYGGVPLSQVQRFAPSHLRTQTPPTDG